mmetsp:Transcript_7718/g.10702  ORF Transcript_7718/g.10702 Transcript_7718/m.10702 type:complete len:146 (+) Transcript_7718:85-522(+)
MGNAGCSNACECAGTPVVSATIVAAAVENQTSEHDAPKDLARNGKDPLPLPSQKAELQGGATYEGQWQGEEKHGEGQLIFPDGSSYNGQFDNNHKHGHGTYNYSDGSFSTGLCRLCHHSTCTCLVHACHCPQTHRRSSLLPHLAK